jgi:cell pole-organizing protein PopZ
VLSEWLDRNLPEIVERLVKDEIARIAGKRG